MTPKRQRPPLSGAGAEIKEPQRPQGYPGELTEPTVQSVMFLSADTDDYRFQVRFEVQMSDGDYFTESVYLRREGARLVANVPVTEIDGLEARLRRATSRLVAGWEACAMFDGWPG